MVSQLLLVSCVNNPSQRSNNSLQQRYIYCNDKYDKEREEAVNSSNETIKKIKISIKNSHFDAETELKMLADTEKSIRSNLDAQLALIRYSEDRCKGKH